MMCATSLSRLRSAALAARRSLAARVRDEAGVTLIIALLTLSVISAIGGTVIHFSTAGARSSSLSSTQQKSLDLAEAGMNLARSTLWQAPDPADAGSVPTRSVTMEGANVQYWGAYNSGTSIWTLYGKATLPNPAGGAPLIRTVSSKVLVTSGQQGNQNNVIWNYLYQDDETTCTYLTNNVTIKVPVYTRGDLCLSNNASIVGPSVQVLKQVNIDNNASIGSAANPIDEVQTALGCKFRTNPIHNPCTPADKVWADTASTAPATLTKPPVDLAGWYAAAKPGPMANCTFTNGAPPPWSFDVDTTMNGNNPTVNLTPSTPYTCEVRSGAQVLGKLSWTPGGGAVPGTLEIDGVVFFDGRVELKNNANAFYQGKGVIYATGQVELANNAKLCGAKIGNSNCAANWNPNQNLLVFVAGSSADEVGLYIHNNAKYQGGAYVINDYHEENNATIWGPVIARRLLIENNVANEFTPFGTLLPGMPSTTTSVTTLENVDGSYSST
ncbi:MAG: pilus assembly PilX N-terminal domain-containing protein [Thermoleophilia bacterium]